MTIVLRSKLCEILLCTARIAYENTYDMREKFHSQNAEYFKLAQRHNKATYF